MPGDDRLEFADVHFQRNRVTRDDWATFAPHRSRVTELLIEAAGGPDAKLCVLGAGNGNDIDLARLLDHYHTITLVDLDPQALRHGLARLSSGEAARIELVAGVDLTGILSKLYRDAEQPVSNQEIDAAVSAARQGCAIPQLSRYDVVASTSVLTQIIDSVVQRVGQNHPRLNELVLAVRDGHLNLIGRLILPDGQAVLITDFVSSDTLPSLRTVPEDQLQQLLASEINQGNFFTGANPGVLMQRSADPAIVGSAATVKLHPPWRWQMGDRIYGVCAIGIIKNA